MFIVLNKEKMIAYGISVLTVIMLFGLASVSMTNQNAIETSSIIQEKHPIYNVETEEKKVAFTMNCAW